MPAAAPSRARYNAERVERIERCEALAAGILRIAGENDIQDNDDSDEIGFENVSRETF